MRVLIRGLAVFLVAGGLIMGCSSTSRKMTKLHLGMDTNEVVDAIGNPFTIRASKVYEDGSWQETWQYIPRFSLNPREYWVVFLDGKVVQWGEPGDWGNQPVRDYKPTKEGR